MTTHSYYGGGGGAYDSFYRSNQRHVSHAVYYDRVAPYGYYDQPPRHNNRSEYSGRPITRTMIHEPEDAAPGEQRARKRISVACRRCRKRKIKCSGDLGDGLGCSACRYAGADGAQCAFIRVGAKECWEVPQAIEITPLTTSISATASTSSSADTQFNTPYGSGPSNSSYGTVAQSQRPSLPTLHTRSPFPTDYESQYESSPPDSYGYASSTMPRQDSFNTSYGLENYRSWSTAAPVSATVTASYYEPIPTYSFGALQAPSFPHTQQHLTRLPSVTTESFSPFHMSHLNSSLPAHTVYERRLPIPGPYTVHYSSSQPPVPQIRPLGSYSEPRVHINGIHSRNAMPWSPQPDISTSSIHASSVSTYAPPSGLPIQPGQSSAAVTEPVLGYQWSLAPAHNDSSSPEISPTSAAAAAESFSSSSSAASVPPAHNFRYPSISSTTSGYGLPGVLADERSNPSSRAPPSLFSWSTESADRQSSGNDQVGNNDDAVGRHHNYSSQIRQPQLAHAASADAFQRRSSYEEQRASTAHRMSLSNLNANY